MKNNLKLISGILMLLVVMNSCKKTDYSMGDLTAPTDVVINTVVVGQDATHPNGDGSGNVKITVTAKNALSYKVDYDANDPVTLVFLPSGTTTKKYTNLGLNTYRITAVAYGKGGAASTVTKDVSVRSDFTVAPSIVTALTNDASRSWVVDKSVAGHLGVGPWSGSSTPEWWSAAINEKVACCPCFYSATFKFTKVSATSYTLQVATPDGAFTKTGSLSSIPGIPASGDEGCYSYGGGTSNFSFAPSSSNTVAASASTKTSILLGGNNTFIGYGALQREYEILSISSTAMYLRIQGTETGNAWYLKMKSL